MTRRARRRQWADGACYHVLSRGHNRETIFADDDDRCYFLGLLTRYKKRFGYRLYHYCVMSNHFLLVLEPAEPRDLSRLMAGLLQAYVHHFHQRHSFVGHLWQGRFKSPAIERDGYLLSCGRYVERNPVEAGLVTVPWDYPWSSCPAHALGHADPNLDANPLYEEFAPAPDRRQQLWREFLMGADDREEVVRNRDWDEAFRAAMHQPQGRPKPRRRGRPRKTGESGAPILLQLIGEQGDS